MLDVRELLSESARAEGLLFLGIAGSDVREDYQRFRTWLEGKYHSGMAFLERNPERRESLDHVHPGTRSVIVLALDYALGDRWPLPPDAPPRVAQYARLPDYHRVFKARAERVAEKLTSKIPGISIRVAVDTAPVLERALAGQTQSGFIGKNTLFIHPEHGSFLLLGEILVDVDLGRDLPTDGVSRESGKTQHGGCGPCDRCQVHCPTDALQKDYSIDATKCLAYWTIEHRGPLPRWVWPWLGTYYFGCDLCQLSCPYNAKPANRRRRSAIAAEERTFPELYEIATMDERGYIAAFAGTPMTRAKRAGLVRNALVAMWARKDPKLQDALDRLSADPDPTIEATRMALLQDQIYGTQEVLVGRE